MNPVLTVLVAYGSWHIGARVIHRLGAIPCVDVVAQARAADDAVAQAAVTRPALVVLDLLLSHGDGLAVLRALRRGTSPPVVIMTSSARDAWTRRECLRERAEHFFLLPDEIDALGRAVQELALSACGRGEAECP